jgi:transposase
VKMVAPALLDGTQRKVYLANARPDTVSLTDLREWVHGTTNTVGDAPPASTSWSNAIGRRTSRMNARGGRLCGCWGAGSWPKTVPRVPATHVRGSGRSPSASHEQGPTGMVNRQHTTSWRAPRMFSAQQQEELRQALTGPAPDGAKHWTCRAVADWMAAKLGRPVSVQRGWEYLQRLTQSRQAPRPRHALANPEQQAAFKKSSARS